MDEQDYAKHICGIRAENFTNYGFKSTDLYWDITGLKNINFFIGQNNSGKSRLLRSLITTVNYDVDLVDLNALKLINDVMINANEKPFNNMDGFHPSFVSSMNDKKKERITIRNFKKTIEDTITDRYHQGRSSLNSSDLRMFMNAFYQRYLNVENFDFYQNVNLDGFNKIYIPLLRGLRPLSEDSDLYQLRTNNDYFQSATGKSFSVNDIFTGYSIYKEIKSSLLGSHKDRIKVREFEKYLSDNFFNSSEITLIPRIDEDMVYLKEGDKEERRIADLGDGLQSIIILTFKLFMADKPTIFFIEEAEQHLHAGMQRALINVFAKHKQHMFFITTHSNHFVDMAQELECVSLQHVYQKIESGKEVSYVNSLCEKSEMLADLGVRASSVLLANCSIWVEGITDRLYILTFMSKYIDDLHDKVRAQKLKNYKENLHYIFTEYQGGNITHWNFSRSDGVEKNQTKARSLSSNILLIADNDISNKADRVTTLKSDLGSRFYLLPYKEIENHLPIEIIKETAKLRWETFNKKVDATFNYSDLKQENFKYRFGIGTVLERNISNNLTDRKFFADDSGTIKDKVKFCTTAISVMNDPKIDWELTPELFNLCDSIWKHIEECNPQ